MSTTTSASGSVYSFGQYYHVRCKELGTGNFPPRKLVDQWSRDWVLQYPSVFLGAPRQAIVDNLPLAALTTWSLSSLFDNERAAVSQFLSDRTGRMLRLERSRKGLRTHLLLNECNRYQLPLKWGEIRHILPPEKSLLHFMGLEAPPPNGQMLHGIGQIELIFYGHAHKWNWTQKT